MQDDWPQVIPLTPHSPDHRKQIYLLIHLNILSLKFEQIHFVIGTNIFARWLNPSDPILQIISRSSGSNDVSTQQLANFKLQMQMQIMGQQIENCKLVKYNSIILLLLPLTTRSSGDVSKFWPGQVARSLLRCLQFKPLGYNKCGFLDKS